MARLIREAIRWVFSTDARTNARRFLFLGLFYALLGGLMALNLRWSLAHTREPSPVLGTLLYPRTHGVIGPSEYATLFTTHGAVMVFFAATPLLHGFLGNLLIARSIGARRLAVPSLSPLSFWLTLAGGAVLVSGMYARWGGPSAGWSAYAPLSTRVGSPGPGITYWCLAMLLAGAGTLCGAVNFVATLARSRDPSLPIARWPLVVWGLGLGALLNVLFTPILLAATALLLFERATGRAIFSAGMAAGDGAAGDPLLWQHLFWLFGHPEVYILILPVWGTLGDVFAHYASRPRAFGHRTSAAAMSAVALLSATVYGHHMFTAGLGRASAQAFMALTVLISVPSTVLVLGWLGTLHRGAIRFEAPLIYALGALVVFAIGGLSGMYLGVLGADVYLHETWFVVGHFHFVMAASVLLGAFAALHHAFPTAFPGRALSPTLGRIHAIATTVLLCGVFGGMLVLGWSGAIRRTYDAGSYDYARALAPLHRSITDGAFVLLAVQLLFAYDLVRALRAPLARVEPPRVEPREPAAGERRFALEVLLASCAMFAGAVGLALVVLASRVHGSPARVHAAVEPRAFERIAPGGSRLDGRYASRAVLERGRDAYVVYCAACHGERGDGRGPSALGLRPRPRDLRRGTLVCANVAAGALPREDDLERAILSGRPGTAMRGWDVPRGQLEPLALYVRWLSPRFRAGEIAGAALARAGDDPWRDHPRDAIERGRVVFTSRALCSSCHASDGPLHVQTNDQGDRVLPADFASGEALRCGGSLEDVVRAIDAGTGDGTMPGYRAALDARDVWALAHFVRGL